MKIKNYMDTRYYVIGSLYFIFCYIILAIIFMFHIDLNYLISAIILTPIVVILNVLYFNRLYILEKNYILLKVGPFSNKIMYKDIEKCYITENYRLSYATSKKRIAIKTNDKEIYISPKNMDEVLIKLINYTDKKEVKEKKKTKKRKK